MKFFYDNFSDEDIAGLYSPEHIFTIALFFLILSLLLFISRRIDFKRFRNLHLATAIMISVIEIVKDVIQIYKKNTPDSWIPLFYCSLFIYAIWLAYSKCEFVSSLGYSYITMGGIMAGIFFTFYPSTSLVWYPIWHPLSIYGFVYHLIMTYFGLLALMRGFFKPDKRHFKHYFIFISFASVIGLVLNSILGTNCMFLRDPMNLPIFTQILEISPILWAAFAFVGQAIMMFWLNFAIYRLVILFKEKTVSC